MHITSLRSYNPRQLVQRGFESVGSTAFGNQSSLSHVLLWISVNTAPINLLAYPVSGSLIHVDE